MWCSKTYVTIGIFQDAFEYIFMYLKVFKNIGITDRLLILYTIEHVILLVILIAFVINLVDCKLHTKSSKEMSSVYHKVTLARMTISLIVQKLIVRTLVPITQNSWLFWSTSSQNDLKVHKMNHGFFLNLIYQVLLSVK